MKAFRNVSFTIAVLLLSGGIASAALAVPLDRAVIRASEVRVLDAAARIYGFDPRLFEAIAQVESGGDPHAASSAGALGLMQLMPATALRFGVSDPFDPVDNALGAARFLSWLRASSLSRHDRSLTGLTLLLAAYNSVDGAVRTYDGVPPYSETHQYVRKVLRAYLFPGPCGTLAGRVSTSDEPTIRRVRLPDSDGSADALDQLATIRELRAIALRRSVAIEPNH